MQNEDKKQTNKSDWKKKGLGWIPDYPDLRDYRLGKDIQKDSRVKRQGDTDAIENLSETFIQIINTLPEIITAENRDEFKKILTSQLHHIENQSWGDVSFVSVRIHRFLREQVPSRNNSCLSRNYYFKSELNQQIIYLKNYFAILLFQKYLKVSESLIKKLKNKIDFINFKEVNVDLTWFNDPTQTFRWLRKEEFDQTTKFLVMLFQYGTQIQVDGVVGLETYTTLNEYFCDPKNLKKLKARITKIEKDSSETTDSQKLSLSPKTRVISVPSLLPTTVFSVIIEELKSSAWQRILWESRQNKPTEEIKNIICEVNFLKDIGVEEAHQKLFAALMPNNFIEKLNEKEPQDFWDNLLKKYHLSTSESFKKIFDNEFFVVEPIVSFVVKLMSPLAQKQNLPLNYVVAEGINKARKFFRKDFRKSLQFRNSTPSINASATNKRLDTLRMQDLAKEALQRVAKSFETEIKLIIQNKSSTYITELLSSRDEKDQEIVSTLCFYFLVKKFLNQFITPEEQCKVITARQPNIFDKQELFELEKSKVWQQNDKFTQKPKKACENKLELFSTPNLQIPVSSTLIKSLESRGLLETDSPKPYIFLPSVVDLSYWDSAVEDQGALQSCTAFAGIALIEYFANRRRGKSIDLSPLFLYKAARNLMSLNGDVGASVRETMKAIALFGVPPEQYWTYEEDKVDEEPPSFCYSYAQNFQALKYFRLDYADMPTEVLVSQIKAVLAAGFPCMFGFTVYTSAYDNFNIDEGYIPFPNVEKDRVVGGHAVVAVGYDDLQTIPCAERTGVSYGAFLIRNSWGTDWGKEGYGWIPYDYILQGLTRDWWSLLKSEWFDEDSYGLGARSTGSGDKRTDQ